MKSCLGCQYADWKRSKNGTLHPSGDGQCTYEVRIPQLPNAKYWSSKPLVSYGSISRKKEFIFDCPYYTRIEQ